MGLGIPHSIYMGILAALLSFILPPLIKLAFVKSNNRAEAICKNLIESNFKDLKMAIECKIPSFSMAQGILAMLTDRLIYFPAEKGEKMEMPINKMLSIKIYKSWFPGLGTLEVVNSDQAKQKFQLGGYALGLVKAGLHKIAPNMTMQDKK